MQRSCSHLLIIIIQSGGLEEVPLCMYNTLTGNTDSFFLDRHSLNRGRDIRCTFHCISKSHPEFSYFIEFIIPEAVFSCLIYYDPTF